MRTRKICIISPENIIEKPGGIGVYIGNLCKHLSKHFKIILVEPTSTQFLGNKINPYTELDNLQIIDVKLRGPNPFFSNNLKYSYQLKFVLDNIFYNNDVDLINGNLPSLSELISNSNKRKVPLIETIHGTWLDFYQSTKYVSAKYLATSDLAIRYFFSVVSSLERILQSRADLLIAVSEKTKSNLSEYYNVPKDKINVIYNAVDIHRFNPNVNSEKLRDKITPTNKDKIIFFAGKIKPIKGLDMLIHAAAIIKKKFPNVRFVLAGKTNRYKHYLDKLANIHSVRNNIIFLGNIPHTKIHKYYACADIVVLPSYYENLPTSVLEGMSSQKPVIATSVGGTPELIENYNDGILISPNVDSLVKGLLLVLEDPDFGIELSIKARKKIEKKFSWEKISRELLHVYRDSARKPLF